MNVYKRCFRFTVIYNDDDDDDDDDNNNNKNSNANDSMFHF